MFFRRSTHPNQDDLSAYIDGELDMAQTRRLAAHLETCDGCRDVLEELKEAKALLAALPRASTSRSFTLSPAQAGVQVAMPATSRPSALRFAPALSLAVLAVLLVVDISTLGNSNQSASTADHGALVAKSSAESANSAAGTTLQASPSTTGVLPQAPRAASNSDAGAPASSSPVASSAQLPPAVAPSLGSPGASSTPANQAQAAAAPAVPPQPSILSQPDGRSATGPTPPGLVPPAVVVPFAVTPQAAAGGATSPAQPQSGSGAGAAVNPSAPAEPGVISPLAPVPSQPQDTSVTIEERDGSGIKLLRLLEILAAAAFMASLFIVFWPRLTRKDR